MASASVQAGATGALGAGVLLGAASVDGDVDGPESLGMTTNATAAPSNATASRANAIGIHFGMAMKVPGMVRRPRVIAVCQDLRMTSPEDPEDRIRQLEQSAAAYGARELGTDQPQYSEGVNPASSLPPPAYGAPPPAYGSPPSYGQQPYGDPYQPPFGTHYTPIQKKSGVPAALVIGLIAVVFVILAGIALVFWNVSSTVEEVTGGGGTVGEPGATRTFVPPSITFPDLPDMTNIPGVDTEQTATPSAPASVAGIDETITVVCENGDVNISGVNNTVTLTGHCANVNVSGVENKITVDRADVIGASGFDNQVVYLSGDPQINNTGSNTVNRG